jgi:uncharacterized protein (TIGR02268 family)
VPASSPAVLVALALLGGAAATAQPRTLPCEMGTRHIELKSEPSGEVPELCIGPGLSTTLLFSGAELLSGGVTVEGRERFTLVEVGNTMLRLLPSERVAPGERLRLTVRFKDEAAPASAAFWLGVHPAHVEPLVEVYRQKRTVESYQQEAKEKDTQLHRCQEDNERLHAEQEGPRGLAGLLALGLMDRKGIAPKDLSDSIGEHPGNVLRVGEIYSYRTTSRVAVELTLEPTQGMPPWRAVKAELLGPGRRSLRVKPPWQREPLRFDVEDKRVVVEADTTDEELQGSFTLKLWNEDGTRSLLVTGVSFP